MAQTRGQAPQQGAQTALPEREIISCNDIACERLVDPIPRPEPAPFDISMRPEIDQVVFVDNRKPNSLEILHRARVILRDQGIDVKDEILRKPSGGSPMPDAMLDALSAERGLVLCGISD